MIYHLSLDRDSVASQIFNLISKNLKNMGLKTLPTANRQLTNDN